MIHQKNNLPRVAPLLMARRSYFGPFFRVLPLSGFLMALFHPQPSITLVFPWMSNR